MNIVSALLSRGLIANPPVEVFIISGTAVFVLLAILLTLIRSRKRKPTVDPERGLREDLSAYPPAPGAPGPKRLNVEGQPARVRLIIVAPAGQQAGINEDGVAGFLDQLVRGLGPIVEQDKPRIRVWPPQLSHRGFAPTFHRLITRPEPEGEVSPWVLLAGPARLGKWQVLLGMALYADQANTLGRLNFEPHQWTEKLRVG
jgi:hypothetical protein